jgi:hypothetical protein
MALADQIRTTRSSVRSAEPWQLVAWMLPASLVLLSVLPTGDLAYQIQAGRIMLSTHDILRHDVFTYTFAGKPWVDQQWGAQILLSALFRLVGWRGLVFARACLVGLAVGLTYRRTRATGSDPTVAGFLSIGAFLVALCVPGTTVLRPQLLALPLFIAAAWILQTRAVHPRRLLTLPLIGIVWANIHGSFVLLPLLVLTAATDDVVGRDQLRRWTVPLTAVCAITPLATPWGPRTYSYVAELASSSAIRSTVQEWQPVYVRWPAGVVFAIVSILAGYITLKHRSRAPTLGEGIGLVAFTVLTVWSARNAIWWALYVPPVLGSLLRRWQPGDRDAPPGAVVVTPVLFVVALVGALRVLTIEPSTALLQEAPTGITSAVEHATNGGQRLFDGSWGSWFEFALPDVPVFLDARGEMAPEQVWQDYAFVMSAKPGWQAVLDGWNVGVVAIPYDGAPPLIDAIERDPGWKLVYQDPDGLVFSRTGPP